MKDETKEMRFKRIAEKRVQHISDMFRKLSQCSNPRIYNWNEEQLKKIWDAISQEMEKCRNSFDKAKPEEFRL